MEWMNLLKELCSQGTKKVIIIIILAEIIVLSISPSFLLFSLFEVKIPNSSNFTIISTSLIVGCILFYLIYIITSIGNKAKLKKMDNNSYIINNIGYTIFKLTLLSVLLLIAYGVLCISNIGENLVVGLSIFSAYILIASICSFIKWIAYRLNMEDRSDKVDFKIEKLWKKYEGLIEENKMLKIENNELKKEVLE